MKIKRLHGGKSSRRDRRKITAGSNETNRLLSMLINDTANLRPTDESLRGEIINNSEIKPSEVSAAIWRGFSLWGKEKGG